MYTQCPTCKTVFRLHLDQLNAARGQVRCSRCHTVFNALDNLYQQAVPDLSGETPGDTTKQQDISAGESLVAMANEAISTLEEHPQRDESSDESGEHPPVAATAKASRHSDKEKRLKTSEASPSPKEAQMPPSGKAHPRPKNTALRKSVARAEKKKIDPESSSAIPRENPPVSQKKSGTAGSQISSAEEETLPLFGPTEAPRGSDVASGTVHQAPGEQRGGASAEATSPLFEFNSIFEEPLFDTEIGTGETPAKAQDAKSKQRSPAASQPQELDLFGWDETTEKEPEDTVLFHYLPKEEQPGELITDGDQTDDSQATPEERAQKQKGKQARPGYTLPLEHETIRGNLKSTLLWSLGIVVMLTGLALQYLYYHRMAFAQAPGLRPLLVEMCKITACQLPPQRDLADIELGKHLVQVHPRYENSLLITAILVNRADFAQPFPVVEVVMTDLEQKQVARRRFLPKEYLIGHDSERLLPPMTEVPLMLEVLDPGKNAVGFEFNFY